MNSLGGFRLLPILMVVAAICFGVRFSEMITNFAMQGAYASTQDVSAQLSQMSPAAGDPAKPVDPAQADVGKPSDSALQAPSEDAAKAASDATPAKTETPKTDEATATKDVPGKPVVEAPSLGEPPKGDWKGADDLDDQYSDVKMEMFQDLSKRKKDLDAKEKELTMREALLKATQAELEQKTNELNTIKSDIEGLLKKQTEQEDARIASLVKIYEGMKAKDAARIFNSLDQDVLLEVVTKMSERKSAPIIAAMDADKARSITIMLAEQNKLPDLPELPASK